MPSIELLISIEGIAFFLKLMFGKTEITIRADDQMICNNATKSTCRDMTDAQYRIFLIEQNNLKFFYQFYFVLAPILKEQLVYIINSLYSL